SKAVITTAVGTGREVRVQVTLAEHFTFTDPYLDADLSVNGHGKHVGIVDIHTIRMQRRTSLLEFFGTGDLGAGQTAADLDLDTFRTHAHSRRDRHLNGA